MEGNNAEMNLVPDIVSLLIEQVDEIKNGVEGPAGDYEKGRLFTFYEVLSLIKTEAEAFGFKKSDIGMEKFDPDFDILLK